MLSNVPQFIDIEDKIVGPLTAKQLGWMAMGGLVLFFTWNLLDLQAFFISVFLVVIVFGSLAFYRPYDQPLINLIFSFLAFIFRPKLYIWKRIFENSSATKKKAVKKTAPVEEKKFSQKNIQELSKMLDIK